MNIFLIMRGHKQGCFGSIRSVVVEKKKPRMYIRGSGGRSNDLGLVHIPTTRARGDGLIFLDLAHHRVGREEEARDAGGVL